MTSSKHVDSAIAFSSSPGSHRERPHSGFVSIQFSQSHLDGGEKLNILRADVDELHPPPLPPVPSEYACSY
jgi:hypothetical protein